MKINGLPVKDCEGNELNIGDRVIFNCSACAGFGEMGTVMRVERDTVYSYDKINKKTIEVPYGDEFQFCMWVKWDSHGKETGDIFDLRDGVKDWKFVKKAEIQMVLM